VSVCVCMCVCVCGGGSGIEEIGRRGVALRRFGGGV
jgi:hypothetical protein